MTVATIRPQSSPEFLQSISGGGHETRQARARLRRDLGSGRLSVLDVLADPPPEAMGLHVYELVGMCRSVGRIKMTRLGRRAATDRINLFVRVDRCSEWTRDWLAVNVPQMKGW
jgi:hypothetical protein